MTTEREKYMITLLQNITPDGVITNQTKIKGATIQKLCTYEGGGYRRVISWLEQNQPQPPEPIKEEDEWTAETDQDVPMDEIEEFFEMCLKLYRERKGKYGNSWRILTPESTANLIEMKAHRARVMGVENAKSLDEALDMCNYAAMLYVKLNEK